MSDLLVDTNLLIYALDQKSEFHARARTLLYHSSYNLFTTSKNLTEFLAVTTRGQKPLLSIEAAVLMIEKIEQSLAILYPSPGSSAILRGLLRKYQPLGLRIHDFEIIAIGLSHRINLIGTKNERDFLGVDEIRVAGF